MSKYKYLEWIATTPTIGLDLDKSLIDNKKYRSFLVPPIYCKDGEYVSVQASETHYCDPRNNYGNWIEFECGYPSVVPPIEWREYAEEWSKTPKQKLHDFCWGIRLSVEATWNYGEKQEIIGAFIRCWKREWHRLITKAPCSTVYGYIPIDNIKKFIIAHGGEDSKRSFDILKEELNEREE